jgi:hypothetical protein
MRNKAKTWGVIGTSKSKRILISSLYGGGSQGHKF